MGKILIIEDDTDINNMISDALVRAGHETTQAFSGTEGQRCISADRPDAIVLDLMLPGISGEEVLARLSDGGENIPVLILSAKDGIENRISLLNTGAVDYMTKPFDVRELIARVNVHLRQSGAAAHKDGKEALYYKDMRLLPGTYQVFVKDHELQLTRQEFQILKLLISNQGRVFSKQAIFDYAWDDYYEGTDKTLNVHISNIRRKIKEYTDEEYIETIWGIGFRFPK